MADKVIRFSEVGTNKVISVTAMYQGQTDGGMAMATCRGAYAYVPADQATTGAYVIVSGSTMDALHCLTASFTCKNTGANSIYWKVLGGNQSDASDWVEVQAEANIAASGVASFSTTTAVWRYYAVYVENHAGVGTAQVRGLVKG